VHFVYSRIASAIRAEGAYNRVNEIHDMGGVDGFGPVVAVGPVAA
jgi:hypothetical protein